MWRGIRPSIIRERFFRQAEFNDELRFSNMSQYFFLFVVVIYERKGTILYSKHTIMIKELAPMVLLGLFPYKNVWSSYMTKPMYGIYWRIPAIDLLLLMSPPALHWLFGSKISLFHDSKVCL